MSNQSAVIGVTLANLLGVAMASAGPLGQTPANVDTPQLARPAPLIPSDGAHALIAFNIPRQALGDALAEWSRQSGLQVLRRDADDPTDLISAQVLGKYSPQEALERLLANTGLTYEFVNARTVRVAPVPTTATVVPRVTRLTQRDPGDQPSSWQLPDEAANGDRRDDPRVLQEIVVTGTLIRGDVSSSSPLLTIDRAAIDRGGYATVAEALAALPQNFAGTATPTTSLLNADPRFTNDTMATSINLRGLGSYATLVLVNGRRLAGAGLDGDFADVSAIPTAAIERVDVLLDGASALYGSDAVGGVVNIIMRRDFDAMESRLRLGGSTHNDARSIQFDHTLGKQWTGGSIVFSYEFEHRANLPAAARAVTRGADLRSFGGTDHRLPYSHPGNLLTFDPEAGAYVSGWAIPPGQDGSALTAQDFIPGQANLANTLQGADLLPELSRHTVYASLEQSLHDNIELDVDARLNRRATEFHRAALLSVFAVTPANPYFVSPDGATSATIGYSFGDELGAPVTTATSESLSLSAGLNIRLGHGWQLETYVAGASEKGNRNVNDYLNTSFLNEALGTIPDNPATTFSTSNAGFFNPYADTGRGGANSNAILDFISSGHIHSVTESRMYSFNAKADGPLCAIPGGDVKAAVGMQVRREEFKPVSVSLVSRATPSTTGGETFSRTIGAAFLEVHLPIVGAGNSTAGIRSLEASVAGRIEHYNDVGQTTNPKVGVVWSPASGWKIRASYGTSFRAPNLTQEYAIPTISPSFLDRGTDSVLTLIEAGGNTQLRPERARSWTAGIDFSPASLAGLKLGAGWFDTNFSGQIGQPVLDDFDNALTNPSYSSFVHVVNPSNPQDLARVTSLIAQSTSSQANLFPPNAYAAIVDARYVNTANVHVRGIDFEVQEAVQRDSDTFQLSANISYLLDYLRAVTPTSGESSLLNIPGEPINLRAHVSGTWSRGPLGATLGINYANHYHTGSGQSIASWTTTDIQLSWRPADTPKALSGLSVALNVHNVFDSNPPFYDSPPGVGYDPANADPFGRILSLQLDKRW